MNITVTLHCKPYVRHWLESQFGSPVKLPRRSTFRHTFLSCLSKKFHASREYDRVKYPSAVDFKLHINDSVQHGTSIQIQLQHHINHVIEEHIKNELFMFIHAHTIKGVTVDKAVLLYQVQYGYTEEVFSFDAIRKAYFRRCKLFEIIFCTTVTKPQTLCTNSA